MKISKKTVKKSANSVKANTEALLIEDVTQASESDVLISEPDVLSDAVADIQCAINKLCTIAETNDRAKTAIVDLGIILVDLSR